MNKFQEYRLSQTTDELKRLIAENPDLPIVVLASEDANDGDHNWMFCSKISFSIDEILDCDYADYGDTVFTDRERLEEKISDDLYEDFKDAPEAEYDAAVAKRLAELEPFWKKVITIWASN